MAYVIETEENLMNLVEERGFVPFFACEIPGASIEELCDPKVYFTDVPGPWEWKGPVISKLHCAYGKFFNKKAGFISAEWYTDFANWRRDGYDFDARVDDNLASYNEQFLYGVISRHHSILSKDAKIEGGYVKPRTKGKDTWIPRKGFDTQITRLQMEGYVLISNFEYEVDRHGKEYGWGLARYAIPEQWFGRTFTDHVYERTPEESLAKMKAHLAGVFPAADEAMITHFLRR